MSSQPGVGHLGLKYWLPRLLTTWLGPVDKPLCASVYSSAIENTTSLTPFKSAWSPAHSGLGK